MGLICQRSCLSCTRLREVFDSFDPFVALINRYDATSYGSSLRQQMHLLGLLRQHYV